MVFTLTAALYITLQQPEIYEARSTFVIRPHSTLLVEDEIVRTLDILSRRVEINNTFAEVANSNLIKDKAAEVLRLSDRQKESMSVSGQILAGTNVLTISVKGNDPDMVRDFAETASTETISYVSQLYDIFELEQLDQAEAPSRPISPKMYLNLITGLAVGLVVGLAVIFLADYLGSSETKGRYFPIVDPDTGVYTKGFFELRLRQEINKARRHDRPLSLALITMKDYGPGRGLSFSEKRDLMSRIVVSISRYLRDQDVLARYDTTTFALMMPDMFGEQARRIMDLLSTETSSTFASSNEQEALENVHIIAGVVEISTSDSDGEELLARAEDALRDARTGVNGRVVFRGPAYPDLPRPPAKLPSGLTNSMPGQLLNSEFARQEVVPVANAGHSDQDSDDLTGNITVGTNETIIARHAVSSIAGADFKYEERSNSKELGAKITRAALKLAREYGLDLHTVKGSGKDGRILKTDIEALIRAN